MFMLFDFDDKILFEIGFFVMSFLSLITVAHYLYNKKNHSIMYLLLGNVSFTLFFLVLLFNLSYRDSSMPYFVAFLDVASIIFYAIAILKMFSIKIRFISFSALALFNFFIVIVIRPYVSNFGIYRFITTFSIVLVVAYLGYCLMKSDIAKSLKSFNYSFITITLLIMFKLFLAFYRLVTFFQGEVWFAKEVSINLMTFISLSFVLWVNFTIIFLAQDLLNKKVQDLSYTDFLTSLPNRRKIIEEININYELSKRSLIGFAVIMIDIDDFKNINDEFGHEIGDQTLQDLAMIFNQCIRKTDFIGRYGGEEFLALINVKIKKRFMISLIDYLMLFNLIDILQSKLNCL